MKTRWFVLSVPVTLALLLLIAPMFTIRGHAQMGPMMGQPLDQLSGDEFDKAFLSQMVMHHGMAVMMARPVVANASHQELKDLAQGMINDQTREIALMRGWAKDWYGLDIIDPVAMMDQMMGQGMGMGMPPAQHPGMGQGMGMGMGMPPVQHPGMGQGAGMGMPGQAGMPMMASMSNLPAPRLEAVFMSQMIPHHQDAVDMANLVPERAAHQELKELAKSIIESQSAEIDTMNGWLASWYSL